MKKIEIQKLVYKNGAPLPLNQFNWHEETKTFSSKHSNLVIDFSKLSDGTMKIANDCTVTVDQGWVIHARFGCVIKTDCNCVICACSACTITTGSYCSIYAIQDCNIKTLHSCIISASHGSTVVTENFSTVDVTNNCCVTAGHKSIVRAAIACTITPKNNSVIFIDNITQTAQTITNAINTITSEEFGKLIR